MEDNVLLPAGPYSIGTAQVDLYDKNRPEIAYPEGRLIPCRWYFPIDGTKNPVLYDKELEVRGLRKFPPLASHCFSKPSTLKEISDGRHPLIILNHGNCVSMTDYTFLAEDLASHGYVVVSICHQLATDQESPEFWSGRSCSKHAQIIDNILYVHDWIQNNNTEIFYDKLDLQKIGFIGHSMGANALLMLANRVSTLFRKADEHLVPFHEPIDSIKECIVFMDGEMPPPTTSKVPIFYMLSEERKKYQEESGAIHYLKENKSHFKHYKGAKHISFMDHAHVHRNASDQRGIYFNGTLDEMINFYEEVRSDIKDFLITAGVQVD